MMDETIGQFLAWFWRAIVAFDFIFLPSGCRLRSVQTVYSFEFFVGGGHGNGRCGQGA